MIKFLIFALCVSSIWALPAQKARNIGGRIIGGSTARSAQFPFAAAIYLSTEDGTYFCSGALISNLHVLTAGSCVYLALLFTVHLGSTSLQANDPNSLRLATDQWHVHPDYDAATLSNDVGIIEFRLPITFSDYVKPVNILSGTLLPDYSSVVTYGWGQTSDQVPGVVDELNYVYLTTLSDDDCKLAFGAQVTTSVVCVDGNFNEGTCRGDSGSALIQFGSQETSYHVGISSFISTNGCESTDPSGFTRTSIYRDWIRNVTNI